MSVGIGDAVGAILGEWFRAGGSAMSSIRIRYEEDRTLRAVLVGMWREGNG
jgi:hypothetical protein